MNGDTNNQQNLTVTSVGNAWVICSSKSRPGFKYYFNTLSGQAVWNLSPEEIEKAKKFTKALPISELEKCPEPAMDPPIDDFSQQSSQQPFNEQTRQMPVQTPNMLPMNLLNLNNLSGLAATLSNITGLPTNMNMQGLPNNMNMQGLPNNINIPGLPRNLNMPGVPGNTNMPGLPTNINNTSGLPTNLNNMQQMHANFNNMPQPPANFNNMSGPNISGLNPFIWNTANNPIQPQPIIYIVAQPQAGVPVQQLPQNLPAQDISYNNDINGAEQTSTSVKKVFNRNRLGPSISNKSDLRQLLRKRCKSESESSIHLPSTNHMSTEQTTIHAKNTILGSKNNLREERSKFDLSVLDNLKPSNSTLLNWFIVVDTKIILENFPFLNKVTDPDQNCYLVVPEHVMCELQELVYNSTDMPTRRILRFLNEQIESELAFRGDEIMNSSDDRYKMYSTCEGLAERNNVILLSDDPGLGRYKNKHVNIHVFRLNEFKQFLTDKRKIRPERVKSPTLKIKIHVPNTHCHDGRPTSSSFFRDQASSGVDNFQPVLGASTSRASEKVHPPTPKKKESNPSQEHNSNMSVENFRVHNSMQNIPKTQATLLSKNSTDQLDNRMLSTKTLEPIEYETRSQSQSSQIESKKHIVLSRNTQNCTNTKYINTHTKYRWRKNRFNASKSESKTLEQSLQAEAEPPVMQETPNTEEQNNVLEEIAQEPVISPIREHSLERSSISSYRKTVDRPNVVIEESSTEGIISNSTEMDSIHRKDSVSSSAKETVSICDDVNFVRHQVVGQSMEEVLRTRRDEWMLRFVQIMEEALREMLRENSPSEAEDNYTAPWATDLPDLARCIIRKYNDHFNVVDAANRLSFTLHRICDSRGNLSANIEPRQYMDMYSYGVYLIESLKQVSGNCDELITTEESLTKLLYDIQNANQDCCHNDTFLDKHNDSIANVPETDVEKPHEPLVRTISDVEKGPLRRQFSNTETNFFSNLSLTRRSSDKSLNTPNSTPNSARIALIQMSSPKTPTASPKNQSNIKPGAAKDLSSHINKDNTKSDDEQKHKDAKDNTKQTKDTTGPTDVKIVRKFVNIPQLEEKLDKIQCIDYYDYDNNEMDCENYDDNELGDGEVYDQESGEYDEEKEEADIFEVKSEDASTDSKSFIKKLTDEIMRPIGDAQNVCSKMVEDLKNTRKPSTEMQEKLKKFCSMIINLEKTLKSIMDRDSTEHKNNVMDLLKKSNLHAYIPDKELYLDTIKNCLKQIDTYQQVAAQVMAACTQQVT